MKLNLLKVAALALPLTFGAGQANSSILELALLIDGSGSISSTNFNLQLQAYQEAFDDNFYSNIVAGSIYDSVYVGAWQFASTIVPIGELSIGSDLEADTFSNFFIGVTQLGTQTNTGGALATARDWFGTNPINGAASVVDISTDGEPFGPQQEDPLEAADSIRLLGGVVNAIGIGGGVDEDFLSTLTTGNNGFFVTATGFDEFGDALLAKLEREVTGGGPTDVPAPATLALLGLGLLGFRLRHSV